jgi:hypothetical protein
MRLSGVLIAISLAAFVEVGCTRAPLTEDQGRTIAQREFMRTCSDFHYSPSSFAGPIPTGVGGAAFAYEWRDKTPSSDFGILVTVDERGVPGAAFLGHIPGVKYGKKMGSP